MDSDISKTFRPSPLKLGNVAVDPPIILAPMAGVTDQDYRSLMAKHGAGMVTTEMISAQGIVRNQPETWHMCSQDHPLQVPLAVQLFGAVPSMMAEAAKRVEQAGAAVIDINAGCPVKKVVKQGAGASLLKEPHRLASMVEAVKVSVSVPVTVKIRLGWDSGSQTIVQVSKMLASAGIDAIAIHGRTAAQKYSGQADWSWIGKVKAEVGIPVVGNGDVTGPRAADLMFQETGCDAIMIGRATQGNPWLLSAIASHWGYGPFKQSPPGWQEFLETVVGHVEAFRKRKPRATGHCRMILIWYSKGCPDASRFRSQLAQLDQPEEMLRSFRDWVQDLMTMGVPFMQTKVGDG